MKISLHVLLLLSGVLFFNLGFAGAGELFDNPVAHPVGSHPYSVTAQDVNQDGYPDIATADRYSHAVSVLINNGDGTFQKRTSYAVVGSDPLTVAGGDLNADGYPDLAVASHYSNDVSVLMNNGDGTFAAAVGYTVGSSQISVNIEDLSGDGYPDLSVTRLYNNTVSILINNGDGTFGAAVSYPVGTNPSYSTAGDVNADGYLDLAVANYGAHTMSVLINNRDGTFAAALHYATGSFPRSVSPGDFNHDGHLDLAVANSNADTVSVFFNNGDGTFAAAINVLVGLYPSFAAVGDFDADGSPDIAAVGTEAVSILINNGDGTFGAAENYDSGPSPVFVTANDLNADGKVDLAVANYVASGTVRILFNRYDSEPPLTSNVVANPNPVEVNNDVTLTATIDDNEAGSSNIASAEYSIDGGVVWVPMAGTFDSPTVEVNATIPLSAFPTPEVHQICVRGSDGADNTGLEECIFLAVYDPEGGFVTGGGWIESPEGAYKPDTSLTGKANFGFVSKYKKGADTPMGNTEFQFHAADLNFHSSSYEWLVVTGTGSNYARFKGTGTINGAGDYNFMTWAGDDDPDTFRIRIWEEDESENETDIYDNGMDQEIDGGSIVIHTKKK